MIYRCFSVFIAWVLVATGSACSKSDPPETAATAATETAASTEETSTEAGEEVTRERLAASHEESIETGRRDLRASCERGDQEACVEAVCFELVQAPTERKYRDCATVQKFKTTDLWVQMSELRASYDNSQSIDVVCMHPQVVEIAGNTHYIFARLNLQTFGRHGSVHEKDRFYVNMAGGPDFPTWEEAADTLCNASRSSE